MKTLSLVIATSTLLLSGCVVDRYSDASGAKFSRTAFGNRTTIGDLTLTKSTNGITQFRLRGYSNDQVEGLRAVAEGVSEGVVKGFKGTP